MMLDKDLCFIDMNESYLAVTARKRVDLLGQYVFDVFPESPEREALFGNAFRRAVAGEANALIRQPFSIAGENGEMREVYWTCHHFPVHDTSGAIVGMAQKAEDVTAQVMADKLQDAIGHEYGHRAKNMLTVIMTVARRTADASDSIDEFVTNFNARVTALARTHDTLARGGWRSTSLGEIVRREVETFAGSDTRVKITGPEFPLDHAQAQALGMAIHELATNAVKYGALSEIGQALDIEWSVDSATGTLTFVWRENTSQPLRQPAKKGFGSTIIDRIVPQQLSAQVERTFGETGLTCTLSMPRAGAAQAER